MNKCVFITDFFLLNNNNVILHTRSDINAGILIKLLCRVLKKVGMRACDNKYISMA